MITVAVIEFGFLFLALVTCYFQVAWYRKWQYKRTVQEELLELFNSEWDGAEENEINAWYRVRYLVMIEPDKTTKQKLEVVQNRIRQLHGKPIPARVSVTPKVQLVGTLAEV